MILFDFYELCKYNMFGISVDENYERLVLKSESFSGHACTKDFILEW
jgi:hypothetical protein